ncbi:MAG: hypothetical protein IPJ67_03920 [Candidatus Moraniibacteriota bacterium]|nr:MAG: hypothetical protein IPJ67_03920 [Candidatus Moranbacteria bacterium]
MTTDITTEQSENDATSEDRGQKIQSLREMIATAERTMQSAKAMLLQLEGKKRVGRPRKVEEIEDGTVVQGTFDGQIMQGSDGKQYPVPANYASKSKLVEGDVLKLTITPDGSFIYKQIGPAERRHAIGVVIQDERGNFMVMADGRPYRVLLASITFFKANPGDEVAIVFPRSEGGTWASIENVLQKGALRDNIDGAQDIFPSTAAPASYTKEENNTALPEPPKDDILSEWEKDFAELKRSENTPSEEKPLE